MVGEKVIENELNKSIKLIIYEDTINNIDKYGKETVTTNTGTGQSYSSTSFKTTIYFGKDKYLQVDSDVPVNYGWTIKALYLKLDNSEEKLLCYKILESNQYYECKSVDEIIAREYGLKSYAAPIGVFMAFIFEIFIDYSLFHSGHWGWGILASIVSFATFLIWTDILQEISSGKMGYKCTEEYSDIISYIYKAMHQLRDKGKQLTK